MRRDGASDVHTPLGDIVVDAIPVNDSDDCGTDDDGDDSADDDGNTDDEDYGNDAAKRR